MSKRSNKSPRTDNEFSKNDKTKHENKKLKQEVARLRKAILRLESGWCPNCTGTPKEEVSSDPQPVEIAPKKDRSCYKCKEGKLVLIKYSKIGEIWYLRRCDGCQHTTRGKRWTDEVED
jgi:hypothetical protein